MLLTLVFSPMKMPEIQIICLIILFKPRTVLTILAFVGNKDSLYVIVL